MINEIDYDTVGTDTAEFIELYNPGTTAYSLSGVAVVLVNGANSLAYLSIPLSALGTLAPGEYVVIGSSSVVGALPTGTRSITFASAQDNVQNGAPDAVALVTGMTTVIDSVSYEGVTTWNADAGVTLTLSEGPSDGGPEDNNTTAGSIGRSPNGRDTDDNSADFRFGPATPGAANP